MQQTKQKQRKMQQKQQQQQSQEQQQQLPHQHQQGTLQQAVPAPTSSSLSTSSTLSSLPAPVIPAVQYTAEQRQRSTLPATGRTWSQVVSGGTRVRKKDGPSSSSSSHSTLSVDHARCSSHSFASSPLRSLCSPLPPLLPLPVFLSSIITVYTFTSSQPAAGSSSSPIHPPSLRHSSSQPPSRPPPPSLSQPPILPTPSYPASLPTIPPLPPPPPPPPSPPLPPPPPLPPLHPASSRPRRPTPSLSAPVSDTVGDEILVQCETCPKRCKRKGITGHRRHCLGLVQSPSTSARARRPAGRQSSVSQPSLSATRGGGGGRPRRRTSRGGGGGDDDDDGDGDDDGDDDGGDGDDTWGDEGDTASHRPSRRGSPGPSHSSLGHGSERQRTGDREGEQHLEQQRRRQGERQHHQQVHQGREQVQVQQSHEVQQMQVRRHPQVQQVEEQVQVQQRVPVQQAQVHVQEQRHPHVQRVPEQVLEQQHPQVQQREQEQQPREQQRRHGQRHQQRRQQQQVVAEEEFHDPALLASQDDVWASFGDHDWSFLSSHYILTTRWIPPSCRALGGECLSMLLLRLLAVRDCTQAGTILSLFPRLVLSLPGGTFSSQRTRSHISRLCRMFRACDWPSLHHFLFTLHGDSSADPPSHAADDGASLETRYRRCLRRIQAGSLSRGLTCLTSSPLAAPTLDTHEQLQSRHPAAPQPLLTGCPWLIDYAPMHSFILERPALVQAISTLSRGAAGGPTGWFAEHLQYLVLGDSGATDVLYTWAQSLLSQGVPDALSPWWSRATLIALSKEGGGVRPIAVGEIFPRFLARACHIQLAPQMARELRPTGQYGVAVSYSTEIVCHAIQSSLATHPTWAVLSVDVANAFNALDRVPMFETLRQSPHFHGLIPFLRSLYEHDAELLYAGAEGQATIHSRTGVRQGDPLSSFLYAYTQRIALQRVRDAHPECQVLSYADDTYLVGPQPVLASAFHTLTRELSTLSLAVQPRKCCVWSPSQIDASLREGVPDIEHRLMTEGLRVLKCPLGTDSYMTTEFDSILEACRAPLTHLPALDDPQAAYRLLSLCLSQSPAYFTRLLPPLPSISRILQRWDDALIDTFGQLLGGGDTELAADSYHSRAARMQLGLPMRKGGFGIRRSRDYHAISHIASWLVCAQPLSQDFRTPSSSRASLFPRAAFTAPDSSLGRGYHMALASIPPDLLAHLQQAIPSLEDALRAQPRKCFAPIARRLEDYWLEQCRDEFRGVIVTDTGERRDDHPHLARLAALQGNYSSAWLQASPTSGKLSIPASCWRTIVRFWAGLPLPQLAQAQVCAGCRDHHQYTDITVPSHALRCVHGGGVLRAHHAVRDVVCAIAREVGLTARREDQSMLHPRIVDVSCRDSTGDIQWGIDVVTTDPQEGTLQHPPARYGTGLANQRGEAAKVGIYRAVLRQHQTVRLRPLAIETFGALGPDFQRFIRDAARLQALRLSLPPDTIPTLIHSFAQRISVAFMRAQAQVLHSRASVGIQDPVVSHTPLISTAADLLYVATGE